MCSKSEPRGCLTAMAKTMSRKFIHATAFFVLMTTSAFAQDVSFSPFKASTPRAPTHDEIEKQQKLDNDYKAAAKKIPDKKVSNDPWADVRSSPNSATESKKTPQ